MRNGCARALPGSVGMPRVFLKQSSREVTVRRIRFALLTAAFALSMYAAATPARAAELVWCSPPPQERFIKRIDLGDGCWYTLYDATVQLHYSAYLVEPPIIIIPRLPDRPRDVPSRKMHEDFEKMGYKWDDDRCGFRYKGVIDWGDCLQY